MNLDLDEHDYINKTILIGVTYFDHEGNELDRAQWYGTISRISKQEGIVIMLHDSDDECRLPLDVTALRKATPGTYRLRSTGEVVVDPDYLTTWDCVEPPANE